MWTGIYDKKNLYKSPSLKIVKLKIKKCVDLNCFFASFASIKAEQNSLLSKKTRFVLPFFVINIKEFDSKSNICISFLVFSVPLQFHSPILFICKLIT